MLITNGRIIKKREILTGHTLVISNGKIAKIAPASAVPTIDEEVIDAAGCFVAPGFIDVHVHGAVGCDTMDATMESLTKIVRYHASGGTTALVPTTVSASAEAIAAVIQTVAEARNRDLGGAQIIGLHLEGPYLAPSFSGAQNTRQIRPPDPGEYTKWLEHDDLITQVTLAPELPGSLEFIEKLAEHEIIPSGGHTAATEDIVRKAVERGLCHATHLFNAMSAVTKKGPYRVAGMAEAALADDNLTVELIADGKHLPASSMKLAIKAKGFDRVCLVTDATPGAGLPEGASFKVGDLAAVVDNGVGLIADRSALAGSTACAITLVKTVTSLGFSLVDTVRMASLTPARLLGVNDRKGSIEEHKDADIVIFDDAFNVRRTIVGGKTVYLAES